MKNMVQAPQPEPAQPAAQGISPPAISLPKGGGAVRGMGEKFAANPVTGTGSLSIPVALSPGRSGFGPTLSLTYDSGAGNGPFGLGWSLGLPAITRKTDKGLPRYRDAEESDVFILSGAEDLVPVLDGGGERVRIPRTVHGVDYHVHPYRPRIEGLFARIERWVAVASGASHWRSISRDNVTTLYGFDEDSRISDLMAPSDPRKVFSYLICGTFDGKGNLTLYKYAAEDDRGVDVTRAHEANREWDAAGRGSQRYLKRILYGNGEPYFPSWSEDGAEAALPATWHFEVVLDYGDHAADAPAVDAPVPATGPDWRVRPDPFSSYRSGFEVRTYRRCERILVFHHFPAEPGVGEDCLVRSLDLHYSDESDEESPADPRNPIYTFLRSATQAGYRRQGDCYVRKSLPPLELEYSQPVVHPEVRRLDAESLANLPEGLDGSRYQWVDLDGEGLSGILTDFDHPGGSGGWGYKRNLSPLAGRARFGPLEAVASLPSRSELGGQQLLDLAGDGRLDVVTLTDPVPGFFERTPEGSWEDFQPFESLPRLDWSEPNLKFVDLTGAGRAGVLVTEEGLFTFYPSLGEEGFGEALMVRTPWDEEKGPRVVLADGAQTIFLADMSGDGLSDLVRIRNGETCYWPNLGYGRFGAKVTMDGAPRFTDEERFDPRRIRLADIDGSGTTDLLYVGEDGVQVCFNRSGNGWAEPQRLAVFPAADNLSAVQVTDLLGNGTACLVWSSPLPAYAGAPLLYVDLMGGTKPHLLTRLRNNLGAETRLRYAPSTRFYLEDKMAGTPWITRVPFPVHVVERVETYDWIGRSRFVTRYAYHHGYFDGYEREFRGFGRVEQWDTEEQSGDISDTAFPEAANWDEASWTPPVRTCTWFHTGAFVEAAAVSRQYAREYWTEPELRLLPDSVLPPGLTPEEIREAYRALKGQALRIEIYAEDGSPRAGNPYTVTEQNFEVRRLQPRGGNQAAVFFVHPREKVSFHYEREPADPRVIHEITLQVDRYGNVLEALAIGYGRRESDLPEPRDRDQQTTTRITCTENRFTNAIDDAARHPDDFRTPLPSEARTYELTGFTPGSAAARFSFAEWESAVEIPYEQTADGAGRQKRLIEHVRTLYRKDDLTAFLPLGEVEPLALPGESYKLALTPGLLSHVFTRRQAGQPDEDLLPDPAPRLEGKGEDQGGFIAMDGNWWIPSGRTFLDPDAEIANPANTAAQELRIAREHFYQPRKVADPFDHATLIEYDTYDLLVTSTRDALGNTVTAAHEYRVLQPWLVTDPNRNRTAAAFDALGMVTATAVMGKADELLGDLLAGFDADPSLAAFIADPRAHAASLLGRATTRIIYDLDRYQHAGLPPCAATLARETHLHEPGGDESRIQISFSYSDGFGREIQKKIQAEPEKIGGVAGPPRWVGSGWTIFNNKGNPVRQYEPFFSATYDFEFARIEGVGSILFYDPVDRVVATLHPNHTYEKVVFDPWKQATWDVNDTVLETDPKNDVDVGGFFRRLPDSDYLPAWYTQRISRPAGDPERDAARKAAAHAGTPTVAHLDALGRPFLTFADNGPDPARPGEHLLFATRIDLDIEGNQRAVSDAKDRIVMRYDYDMLGNRVHQSSMEAGERWMLNDVAGKPIRAWDSRRFLRSMTYDELRRPTGLHVSGNGEERLAEQTIYGESQGDAANHRTRVYQIHDGAGVVTSIAYDFKGNLIESRRELRPSTDGSFTSRTTYDALNRPHTVTSPDGSMYRPAYNEANLLDQVHVNLRGAVVATPFVTNIDYDAKGQRTRIVYGNGALSTYRYDPFTFRLAQLTTTRLARRDATASALFENDTVVQNLLYTYDPAGNVTRIEDAALKHIVHDGQPVDPVGRYTYDAIYRLIEAQGREHIGQTGFDFDPPEANHRDHPFAGPGAHPNDLEALRNYTERYEYDAAGNFEVMRHLADGGSWTRRYDYEEASLLEAGRQNNRLTRTTLGNGLIHIEPYTHDAHGNMTAMPHLAAMVWDFEDQLQKVDLGGGGTAYYVYDATGQRVRKVIESQSGVRRKERIYLGGFEIYREYSGDGVTVTLERESLHVMDGKERVALVETQTKQNGTLVSAPTPLQRYQLGNHLGSASVELSENGALISYEEYHPYGTTAFQAGRSAAEVSLKRYRYTGMERDGETGLSYHGARYYASWLGRWCSTDPKGLVDGANLFSYVQGNPIRLLDQGGTESTEFLPGTLTDYEHLGDLWHQAARETLESRFGEESLEANMQAYRNALDNLPEGSSRTDFARGLFGQTRSRFYTLVAPHYREGRQIFGGLPLTDAEIGNLERGAAPRAGVQIHHSSPSRLAAHPEDALNPMILGIRTGHARTPGGSHHAQHEAEDAVEGRMRDFEDRVAERSRTSSSAASPVEEPASPPRVRVATEAAEVVEEVAESASRRFVRGASHLIPIAGAGIGLEDARQSFARGEYIRGALTGVGTVFDPADLLVSAWDAADLAISSLEALYTDELTQESLAQRADPTLEYTWLFRPIPQDHERRGVQ